MYQHSIHVWLLGRSTCSSQSTLFYTIVLVHDSTLQSLYMILPYCDIKWVYPIVLVLDSTLLSFYTIFHYWSQLWKPNLANFDCFISGSFLRSCLSIITTWNCGHWHYTGQIFRRGEGVWIPLKQKTIFLCKSWMKRTKINKKRARKMPIKRTNLKEGCSKP